MNRLRIIAAASLVALTGIAVAQEPTKPSAPAPSAPATAAKSIVETAMATGMHNTFIAAVKAAGLDGTLKSGGPFTVFAPTDAAFKKLPPGTLENLLKPENQANLANILKFHVIPGNVSSAEIAKMKESSATLAGMSFKIENKEGKVFIGTGPKEMCAVTKTDIKCTNGVIHVIDGVMMPPAK